MVFGNGGFGRYLGLDMVMSRVFIMGLVSLQAEEERVELFISSPCERQ